MGCGSWRLKGNGSEQKETVGTLKPELVDPPRRPDVDGRLL